MKRIIFFKCFKIDDAVQSGLQAFNKEAGYPVSKNTNEENNNESVKELNFHTSKKSLFNLVKLLAILKNIFL